MEVPWGIFLKSDIRWMKTSEQLMRLVWTECLGVILTGH